MREPSTLAKDSITANWRLTPQFSGGALAHAARREDIMK
jgi:hypothetical protein